MLELAQLIKNKREAAGLSQKKLGKHCGVSDSEILKIETGVRKNPNWNTLCKIAHTLNFHPFEILLAAGYITENDINPTLGIKGLETLHIDDVATVQLFIDFLIARSKSKNNVLKEERLCHLD